MPRMPGMPAVPWDLARFCPLKAPRQSMLSSSWPSPISDHPALVTVLKRLRNCQKITLPHVGLVMVRCPTGGGYRFGCGAPVQAAGEAARRTDASVCRRRRSGGPGLARYLDRLAGDGGVAASDSTRVDRVARDRSRERRGTDSATRRRTET